MLWALACRIEPLPVPLATRLQLTPDKALGSNITPDHRLQPSILRGILPAMQSHRQVPPPPPEDSPNFAAVRRHKKAKKGYSAANGHMAPFHDVYGPRARAEVSIMVPSPIRISDVQGLLMWMLAEGQNVRWCFVKVGSCSCQHAEFLGLNCCLFYA